MKFEVLNNEGEYNVFTLREFRKFLKTNSIKENIVINSNKSTYIYKEDEFFCEYCRIFENKPKYFEVIRYEWFREDVDYYNYYGIDCKETIRYIKTYKDMHTLINEDLCETLEEGIDSDIIVVTDEPRYIGDSYFSRTERWEHLNYTPKEQKNIVEWLEIEVIPMNRITTTSKWITTPDKWEEL